MLYSMYSIPRCYRCYMLQNIQAAEREVKKTSDDTQGKEDKKGHTPPGTHYLCPLEVLAEPELEQPGS